MNTSNLSRRQFIKTSIQGASIFALSGTNILNGSEKKEYEILIKKGMVFDGLGNEGKEFDIALKNNKIFKIGKNLNENKASLVIDAREFAVSPGFIDAHSHTDTNLLINPKAESQIRQGVTTDISGNCGDSPFPLTDPDFEEAKKSYKEKYDIDLDWKNINEYFEHIEKSKIAINYATFLGQGNLRGFVVGLNDRPATETEIFQMQKIIGENMKAGALGISSGLEYTPGSFASTSELIELCKVVAKYKGVYATHMRNEDDRLIEAMQESIKIAGASKVSLQISHLKTCYPRNWNKIDSVISTLEEAKKNGVNILADRYPYTAFSTGLGSCFPLWVREGKAADFIGRLKDPDLNDKIRSAVGEKEAKFGSWEKVFISSVVSEKNKSMEGKNILQISKEAGKIPYELVRDLLIDEKGEAGMIVFAMSEDNLKRILSHPLVVIGADGAAIAPYGILGKGNPHPRHYGTFARVIRKYAMEDKIFPLEKAIQKMTSVTAAKFGLMKRGQIKEGYFADLAVFNPDKVADMSEWTKPHQYAKGIEYVIVNGQLVINHGKHTGLLPGKVIRRGVA